MSGVCFCEYRCAFPAETSGLRLRNNQKDFSYRVGTVTSTPVIR